MTSADQTRHVEPGPDDRNREERKRDRQMIELLNELRIALPGVQILFAFLLTVPFSVRFEKLTGFQRDVYYATLIATALSTACLIAPSAAHRLRFHQGERTWIVESANELMIAGLAFLALALGGSVLLITDVMFDGARVWIYSGAVWLVIAGLWFVRPLARHARGKSSGP
jgi:4-amino-4-deoxy-L-arabinose transferase-like glycosyltransferase